MHLLISCFWKVFCSVTLHFRHHVDYFFYLLSISISTHTPSRTLVLDTIWSSHECCHHEQNSTSIKHILCIFNSVVVSFRSFIQAYLSIFAYQLLLKALGRQQKVADWLPRVVCIKFVFVNFQRVWYILQEVDKGSLLQYSTSYLLKHILDFFGTIIHQTFNKPWLFKEIGLPSRISHLVRDVKCATQIKV